MYAEELLSALPLKKIIGMLPDQVTDIVVDSRSVQPNSMFVCIKGYTVDGHDYAQKAVDECYDCCNRAGIAAR
nr:Mur ligase domain-containing protein [Lysinibacillus sphaericus]